MPAFPLLAVHISDAMLTWPWQALGLILSAMVLGWSLYRIHEDEIPRIGIMAAVFFVSSLIHVRVGPSSVHLLLNGLVGLILGRRAIVAIAVGLLLQALLFGHGGYLAIGVNLLVIGVPALLAVPLFRSWISDSYPSFRLRDGGLAISYLLYPPLMIGFTIVCIIRLLAEGDRRRPSLFRVGFVVGLLTVILTATLNSIVLIVAGAYDWRVVAAVVWVVHIPLALIEGVIVGVVVTFLAKVKPEMLQGLGNTSSSGTSHWPMPTPMNNVPLR